MTAFRRIYVKNFLGLREFELGPDTLPEAGPVLVQGRNDAGKTSLLEAIRWVFSGESDNSLIYNDPDLHDEYREVRRELRELRGEPGNSERVEKLKERKEKLKNEIGSERCVVEVEGPDGYVLRRHLSRRSNRSIPKFFDPDGNQLDQPTTRAKKRWGEWNERDFRPEAFITNDSRDIKNEVARLFPVEVEDEPGPGDSLEREDRVYIADFFQHDDGLLYLWHTGQKLRYKEKFKQATDRSIKNVHGTVTDPETDIEAWCERQDADADPETVRSIIDHLEHHRTALEAMDDYSDNFDDNVEYDVQTMVEQALSAETFMEALEHIEDFFEKRRRRAGNREDEWRHEAERLDDVLETKNEERENWADALDELNGALDDCPESILAGLPETAYRLFVDEPSVGRILGEAESNFPDQNYVESTGFVDLKDAIADYRTSREKEAEHQRGRREELQETLKELKNERDELQEQIDDFTDNRDIDELPDDDVEELTEQVESEQDDLDVKRSEKQETEKRHERIDERLSSINDKIETLDDQLEAEKERKQKRQDLTNRRSTIQEELDELPEPTTDERAILPDEVVEFFETKLDDDSFDESDAETVERFLERHRSALSAAQAASRREQLKQELDSINEMLDNLDETDVESIQNELRSLYGQKGGYSQSLDSLSETINELDSEIDDATRRIEALKTARTYRTLTIDLQEVEDEIEQAEKRLEDASDGDDEADELDAVRRIEEAIETVEVALLWEQDLYETTREYQTAQQRTERFSELWERCNDAYYQAREDVPAEVFNSPLNPFYEGEEGRPRLNYDTDDQVIVYEGMKLDMQISDSSRLKCGVDIVMELNEGFDTLLLDRFESIGEPKRQQLVDAVRDRDKVIFLGEYREQPGQFPDGDYVALWMEQGRPKTPDGALIDPNAKKTPLDVQPTDRVPLFEQDNEDEATTETGSTNTKAKATA